MAIAVLEDEQNAALFRTAGRAYGMLDCDLAAGDRIIRRVAAASPDSSAGSAIAAAFVSRQQASADRVLVEGTQRSEVLMRGRKVAAAEALVNQVDLIAEFASPRQKTEWQNYTSKLSKKGVHLRTQP
jgi:predicted patatin/cPLA2 family phospholipase